MEGSSLIEYVSLQCKTLSSYKRSLCIKKQVKEHFPAIRAACVTVPSNLPFWFVRKQPTLLALWPKTRSGAVQKNYIGVPGRTAVANFVSTSFTFSSTILHDFLYSYNSSKCIWGGTTKFILGISSLPAKSHIVS